jgi:hypothetical protein
MANPPLNRSAVDAFIGQPAKPESEAAPTFRERDSTQRMAVNMPKSLYEELRAFMKLTDTPMSELLVEGARRELARRKQGGK